MKGCDRERGDDEIAASGVSGFRPRLPPFVVCLPDPTDIFLPVQASLTPSLSLSPSLSSFVRTSGRSKPGG